MTSMTTDPRFDCGDCTDRPASGWSRWLLLLLALLPLVFSTGCANAIYKSGYRPDARLRGKTEQEVRKALGTPACSGFDDGRNSAFDEFLVRSNRPDPILASSASEAAAMTFGLSEFIAVPQALWWCAFERTKNRVRVYYSDGRCGDWQWVDRVYPNGKPPKP